MPEVQAEGRRWTNEGKYLVCTQCRIKYPVNEHGIPIMLIERAEPLDA